MVEAPQMVESPQIETALQFVSDNLPTKNSLPPRMLTHVLNGRSAANHLSGVIERLGQSADVLLGHGNDLLKNHEKP